MTCVGIFATLLSSQSYKDDIVPTINANNVMYSNRSQHIISVASYFSHLRIYERKDTKHHNNNVDNVDNKLST